jgi:hypothetical protein
MPQEGAGAFVLDTAQAAASCGPPRMPLHAAGDLLARCREASLALLERNCTPGGILAATPGPDAEARRYTRIFGRDAAICALAMSGSGVPALEQGAIASLDTLAAAQAPNGQIPKFVDPEGREADFWYLGCIDATLWWLLAVEHVRRVACRPDVSGRWDRAVERALQWLQAQEHPHLFLLQQNEASDWADIMPRSGFVLYTNALWYRVKRLYGLPQCEDTRHHAGHVFHPFRPDLPAHRRARLLGHYARRGRRSPGLFLSFVNLSFTGDEGDVFGNVLATLYGLAGDSMSERVLRTLEGARAADPWPVRSVLRPIERGHALWRAYMSRHRQNYPHQYHNGGLWPFIGGFWVMALARWGKHELARAELLKLAAANEVGHWRFSEWFHGQTLEPSGMAGQSWNAATFLLAYRAVGGRGAR